jgi:hypothetical protein
VTSKLAAAYPHLVPTDIELKACTEELLDPYIDYVTHVSPYVMAISLNTSAYILWAARKIRAESAIDFGSGFTSYVLRLACDDVWSVDDSPEWLEWSARFLERYGMLHVGHLERWHLFAYRNQDPRDIVVYDFSGGDMRNDNFGYAISMVGSIGVLDDAQHPEHQKTMHQAAREQGYDLFGLRDWTCDGVDRYAALVVKP